MEIDNCKEKQINRDNNIESNSTKNNFEKTNITELNKGYIIFNGKEFKMDKRSTEYERKDKIKRIIYKCVNCRKEESFRQKSKQTPFCHATIEYIEPNQRVKSGYFLKKEHSVECNNISIKINIKQNANDNEKQNFISFCEEIMNKSNIYDRTLFMSKFKELYNKNKYHFPLNNNLLSNIITKWKNNSNRFTKLCIFDNQYDYDNRFILRTYRFCNFENIEGKN